MLLARFQSCYNCFFVFFYRFLSLAYRGNTRFTCFLLLLKKKPIELKLCNYNCVGVLVWMPECGLYVCTEKFVCVWYL